MEGDSEGGKERGKGGTEGEWEGDSGRERLMAVREVGTYTLG